MYFKVIHRVHIFLKSGDSIDFAYSGPHKVTVNLRALTAEETATGAYSSQQALCTALGQWSPLPRIGAIFESLDRNEVPKGTDLSKTGDVLDERGGIKEGHRIPFSALPESLRSFQLQALADLDDKIRRTIRALKWRCNMGGPHNPVVATEGQFFSLDGKTWRPLLEISIRLLGIEGSLHLTEGVREQIQQSVSDGADEPIGRELYREAWEQRLHNPRSALVLGIAAAEVGFKDCASTLQPAVRWLSENSPSPPLVQMLQQYLPQLPAKCNFAGRVLPPPKAVVDQLKKGVSMRNRVSHASGAHIDFETLEEVLYAVSDLLWLLDYYCGSPWALDHIRPPTKAGLGI